VSQRSIGGRSAEVKGECEVNNPVHRQLDDLKVPVGLESTAVRRDPMLGASAEPQNRFFGGSAVELGKLDVAAGLGAEAAVHLHVAAR
jgi:hypothetical protein